MDNAARDLILPGMTQTAPILIVGGSLNGTTLALALAQNGFDVTMIDALPKTVQRKKTFDGRSYAVALASKRLLEAVGLWDQIAPDAQPMLEIKVTDGRAGEGPSPFMMHFDHAEIEEGPMGYMVEDRNLRRALLDAVKAEPRITHLAKETVTDQALTDSGVQLTLASGKTLEGALLIGADGRRSGTAERAGIKRKITEYGQTALVCAVAHEKPHGGIAHQFFMPAGPLAILPLTGNRSSIVWSERTGRAEEVNALDDAAYLEVLRPRFGDFLGEISLAGDRYTYPLNLTTAERFTAPRVALVGDAAQGVHPIAGQGLNAGLRDVAALAEVLTLARRRGQDIASPTVLAEYERWRRFDRTLLGFATDGFNRLFSNDNPILRLGRDLGMGIVNAVPRLRRGFIREAAGLTGDLPKLLQGKSI